MKHVMTITVMLLLTFNAFAEENEIMQKNRDQAWRGRTFLDEGYKYVYGFNGKVIFEKREKDSIFQKLEYLELPNDILGAKRIIELTNLIIEKYNDAPQNTPLICITLTEEWKPLENQLKRKYDNNSGSYDFLLKFAYETREDEFPSMIFFDTFVGINYPVSKGQTLLLPGLRILFDDEGKVKYVACFYPPLNEDFVYILRRTTTGWQFFSFSLEDETTEPGPYFLWDNDGKLLEQGTKTLYLRDYDMPVDSEKIMLRDTKPHEFFIPSKSANISIGH